ncbi:MULTISPECIES: precorrin-4 C(11)-methyltransferase [Caloramator]|uniref:Cobalt-precorrin-4 C11-methyltransferase n=1 Tax=Caloramator australicus RC3 TaxID=857293 RepID=I7LHC8_9CLOT|nr:MULTISPECIES: precorrin-4 C(11)-methyltransferase [Caloramator]MDO6353646.1 precorrin-4 C(11)-methyltransferase [Caloramator sp. CAR-1]CCJ33941.1 Cobalt-precorrin-4 C11-methyltransferase [Caloramator australicus RC3]
MVYFVGAGPGDVDLITVKGRKLLEKADVIIYAGSLVSSEHLKFCREDAIIIDSSRLTLEEIIEYIRKYDGEDKVIVRLHTGDPTIYGAIGEQMDQMDKLGIKYEIIPGVSSFTASCSVLKKEFTVPKISQSIIITRLSGRTSVPESEDLELLAKHKASMAIFLSVQDIDKVVEKLIKGYEDENVPVAVVYKATWKDEKIILGTLKDIAEKVKSVGINKTAQILVGEFLKKSSRSLLYSKNFSHGFREAKE